MSVATDTARVGSWVGSPTNKRLVVAMGIIAAIVVGALMALPNSSESAGTPQAAQVGQLTAAEAASAERWQALANHHLAAQAAEVTATQAGQVTSLDEFWRTIQGQQAAERAAQGYSVQELLGSIQHLLPKAEPAARPSYIDQIEDVQFGPRSPAITVPYSGLVTPN